MAGEPMGIPVLDHEGCCDPAVCFLNRGEGITAAFHSCSKNALISHETDLKIGNEKKMQKK